MFATPAGKLILGQSLIAPFFPVSTTISLAKTSNASKTTLSILEDGKETKMADEVPLQRSGVSFQNGKVLLKGTVTRVASKRRLPAIVLLHGSGPEDREYIGPWIGFLAAQGYAVLAYDKRGVGESTGDWKQSGLEALAGDAIAAVRRLENLDDVDAARIGLVGLSQGGWIAPQVAAEAPEVKFIILHGGPVLSVGEEDLAAFRGELEGYGFPETEITEAIGYRELDNQVTNGTGNFDALQRRYRELKNKGAEWLLSEPASPNDWFRTFYRRIFSFDPGPFWRKVSVPVLALYGERDRSVPPTENVARLKSFKRTIRSSPPR